MPSFASRVVVAATTFALIGACGGSDDAADGLAPLADTVPDATVEDWCAVNDEFAESEITIVDPFSLGREGLSEIAEEGVELLNVARRAAPAEIREEVDRLTSVEYRTTAAFTADNLLDAELGAVYADYSTERATTDYQAVESFTIGECGSSGYDYDLANHAQWYDADDDATVQDFMVQGFIDQGLDQEQADCMAELYGDLFVGDGIDEASFIQQIAERCGVSE